MAWSILIEDIPPEGLEVKKEEAASCFGLESNNFVHYTEPVSASLKIEKEGKLVRVSGDFSLKAGYICARCLVEFFKEIKSSIDTVYEPEPSTRAAEETYSSEEELKPSYYGKEKMIDLGEEIRQGVFLSLPVKPLCREACRGLCPYCGQNLNQSSCSCRIEKMDSRFSKLKIFQAQGAAEKERKR